MDTYSDQNSAPPELPDESAGSSVSSRLQDEYEELLKYAVVVPKIDVDDLPRVLADSKRALSMHKNPTPLETLNSSHYNESDEERDTWRPQAKQGLGKIISPHRRQPNKEADIKTVTPKTRISPSQAYRHQPRLTTSQLLETSGGEEESSSDGEIMYEKTITETERAPSNSDLNEIERKLDLWTRQLNSNIMDEISKLKIKLVESSRHELHMTESRHAGEINTLRNEMEGMKELLSTYEISMERKDGVIANLTRSLQNQKDKLEQLKTFTQWKIQFAAAKQEGYGLRLAAQHYNQTIKKKCWRMWHMVIVEKWRRRVEKACQAKAQEVCISLTNDYETKLKSLEEKYNASRGEVLLLHKEREMYEENMKKAFMRGVCALNMEAMNMFHEPEPGSVEEAHHMVHSQSHTTGGDLENLPPAAESDHSTPPVPPAGNASFSRSVSRHTASPLTSRSYTVAHGPAYTTSTSASLRNTRSDGFVTKGKRLTANVTATGTKPPSYKPTIGKPNTASMVSGRNVLVERHGNTTPTQEQAGDFSNVNVTKADSRAAASRHSLSSKVVRIVH